MELVSLRTLGFVAATATFIVLSPPGATASEKEATAPLSPNPEAFDELPDMDMNMVPQIDWNATLDSARDWTGLMRIPRLDGDAGAGTVTAGGQSWFSDVIERSSGQQAGTLAENGDL